MIILLEQPKAVMIRLERVKYVIDQILSICGRGSCRNLQIHQQKTEQQEGKAQICSVGSASVFCPKKANSCSDQSQSEISLLVMVSASHDFIAMALESINSHS